MRHSRTAWLLVVAGASLMYAGCGPSNEADGGGPTSTESTSSTSPSPSPTTTSASPTPIPVPAPQPGPASPDAPGPISWFASLQRGDCAGLAALVEDAPESLQDVVPLYGSLAEVCAWLHQPSSPVDWEAAKAALQGSAGLDFCLDVEARQLLAGLVDAHDQAPNAPVLLGDPEPGTACPSAVTEVLIGNVTGDIRGQYLYEVVEVSIDGQAVEQNPPDDDNPEDVRLSVFVPCLIPGSQVDVVVRGVGYTHTVTSVPVPADLEQEQCEPSNSSSASAS